MSVSEPPVKGYRVAIVGASSLLGKELLSVLRHRRFPFERLVEIGASGRPDFALEPPILDLDVGNSEAFFDPEVRGDELDIAFVAARPDPLPSFLRPQSARPGVIIDMEQGLAESLEATPLIALANDLPPQTIEKAGGAAIAAAHPATIVLSLLLARLASQLSVRSAVAHIFLPASNLGSRGIDELQKQTVGLLSFQKIPKSVFGAQLAFNNLPRLGGSGSGSLEGIAKRVRGELERSFTARIAVPALRFIQASVFYSLAISLYVELQESAKPSALNQALEGSYVKLRRPSEQAPTQVEAAGGNEILIDSALPDAGGTNGFWIWAAADNLHLAAENAVRIAEAFTRVSKFAETGGRPN